MNFDGPQMRPCPVCEQAESTPLSELHYALFDDLNMSGDKELRQCLCCGVCFDWVRLNPEQLTSYYLSHAHYVTAVEGGTGGSSADNQVRYQRILELLNPGPGALILDYGCGQGGFLQHCQAQGHRSLGLEPSLLSRQAGQAHGPIYPTWEALQADVDGQRVTHLVLSHVLEHLLYPFELLRTLVAWAPNARFYLEVPEASAYLNPLQMRWQELYFEHLTHFRLNDLKHLARRSALGICEFGHTPFSPAQASLCSYLVAETSAFASDSATHSPSELLPSLPAIPIPMLPPNQPIALWGISQYAMLLLGSWQERNSGMRLFDASPAKVGRRIQGLEIEPSDQILSLSPDFLLLIPHSASSAAMQQLLIQWRFKGKYAIV